MGILDSFFGKSSNTAQYCAWQQLQTVEEYRSAVRDSYEKPIVLFKHSTSCYISKLVKEKFEAELTAIRPSGVDFYYLDLLHFRPISNLVANELKVNHQSPQLIIVKNGEAVFNASHSGIEFSDVLKHL